MRRGILATRDELISLRSRIARKGFDVIYDALRRRCSLILEASPVTEMEWQSLWQQGRWGAALISARTAQGRILDLLIAHHVDPNLAYRDRAIEELMNLVGWSTWTDPCHSPLPADLCTAEAAVAAAVALDWLWEDLPQAQRIRVRQALRRNAIEPYRKGVSQQAFWYSCYHNWNAIVNSGCGLAGLALGDEEPKAQEAYNLARAGLKNFFAALGREGGWDEGTGYWGAAMRNVLLFGEAASRLLDDQSIFHSRGMDATGLFGIYFTPNGQPASFGDSPSVPLWGAFYLLVKHYGLKEVTWWLDNYAFRRDASTTGYWSAGLALLFRPVDIETPPTAELMPLKVFHEIGWAAMADHWPRPSLYVAAKTGDLAANHSQRDMNSIQLQLDGEMLLTDMGNPPYSREYFSPERVDFYEVQACAHNTITIAGRDHQIDAHGDILDAQKGKDYRWLACDAGGACGPDVRFIRHLVMIVNPATQDGRMLIVLDELDIGVPEKIDLYWHTRGQIKPQDGAKSGMIAGRQAAMHYELTSTVKFSAAVESRDVTPSRCDRVLHLTAGVIDDALLVSVFSREPIRGKVQLTKAPASAVNIRAGNVKLHFKKLKQHLELDKIVSG